MNRDSVYIIETPLQLLNAIEAKHYFEHENALLIVLLTGMIDRRMFKAVLNDRPWPEVRFVNYYKRLPKFARRDFALRRPQNPLEYLIEKYYTLLRLRQRRAIDAIAKYVTSANCIVLGNYRQGQDDGMKHFCARVPHSQAVVLDDGTDSLQVISERYTDSKSQLKSALCDRNRKRLRARLRRKYVEWDSQREDSLVFFSTYDLLVRPPDKLIKNEYKYWRKVAKHGSATDDIVFLGQSLDEDGLMTVDGYVGELRKVAAYFAGKSITYVPHPRESNESIAKVSKLREFNVVRMSAPIEYELALRTKRPAVLASFYCSALDNCRLMFGDAFTIISFRIDSRRFLKENPLIGKIYKYFRQRASNTFKVIPL